MTGPDPGRLQGDCLGWSLSCLCDSNVHDSMISSLCICLLPQLCFVMPASTVTTCQAQSPRSLPLSLVRNQESCPNEVALGKETRAALKEIWDAKITLLMITWTLCGHWKRQIIHLFSSKYRNSICNLFQILKRPHSLSSRPQQFYTNIMPKLLSTRWKIVYSSTLGSVAELPLVPCQKSNQAYLETRFCFCFVYFTFLEVLLFFPDKSKHQ